MTATQATTIGHRLQAILQEPVPKSDCCFSLIVEVDEYDVCSRCGNTCCFRD